MRVVFLVTSLLISTRAFTPRANGGTATYSHASTLLASTTAKAETSTTAKSAKKPKTNPLGLITFDLDDTLYPIQPVIDEANAAFARAMNSFGFEGIQPNDIVQASKQIRQEISEEDPQKAAVLTHTEIRLLAIRREMERVILKKKLQATADDWATPVSDLSPIIVSHAKKYVQFW